MSRKTYRKPPKGQSPSYGQITGIATHGANCPCRTCRRGRSQGRPAVAAAWQVPAARTTSWPPPPDDDDGDANSETRNATRRGQAGG